MIHLIKTEVPSKVEGAQWKDGKMTSYLLPNVTVFLVGHEKQACVEQTTAKDGKAINHEVEKEVAFEIRVPHPVTRARAITAAEMSAYNLVDDLDVASFNAGLARKSREGVDLEEVSEHDEFIAWVKQELNYIGV